MITIRLKVVLTGFGKAVGLLFVIFSGSYSYSNILSMPFNESLYSLNSYEVPSAYQQEEIHNNKDAGQSLTFIQKSDMVYGELNAPYSLITYSNYSCVYCRKMRPIWKRLINQSKGQINWVYRHFPGPQEDAKKEAEAALCASLQADANMFWNFSQSLLVHPRSNNISSNTIIQRASTAHHLNAQKLEACIADKRFDSLVKQHQQQALDLGFNGTPGMLFVNHKNGRYAVKQGAMDYQSLNSFFSNIQDE